MSEEVELGEGFVLTRHINSVTRHVSVLTRHVGYLNSPRMRLNSLRKCLNSLCKLLTRHLVYSDSLYRPRPDKYLAYYLLYICQMLLHPCDSSRTSDLEQTSNHYWVCDAKVSQSIFSTGRFLAFRRQLLPSQVFSSFPFRIQLTWGRRNVNLL